MRYGEQTLPEAVVDLVRARVQQVFALQINARAAQMLGQARRELKRRRTTGEILEQIVQLRVKRGIGAGRGIGLFELFERRYERFRHVSATVGPVATSRVRHYLGDRTHADLFGFCALF